MIKSWVNKDMENRCCFSVFFSMPEDEGSLISFRGDGKKIVAMLMGAMDREEKVRELLGYAVARRIAGGSVCDEKEDKDGWAEGAADAIMADPKKRREFALVASLIIFREKE